MSENKFSLSIKSVASVFFLAGIVGAVIFLLREEPPLVSGSDSASLDHTRIAPKGNSASDSEGGLNAEESKARYKENGNSVLRGLLPDDLVFIYDALSKINVDEEGNVVADRAMKDVLEKSFNGLSLDVSEETLLDVQNLIQLGLPSAAGDQAAKIFKDYYGYRVAEAALLDSADTSNIDAVKNNFETLVSLRYSMLGHDVAEGLYAEEHNETRRLLGLMTSNDDPAVPNASNDYQDLDSEESQQSIHKNAALSNGDWEKRYREYVEEKQHILSAKLNKNEENKQMEDLLRKHFEEHEFESVINYEIETSNHLVENLNP